MTTATRVKYETRSVKTVRGLEARTRAKLEQEGWEFVSQEQGTVRSELTFRRDETRDSMETDRGRRRPARTPRCRSAHHEGVRGRG